MIDGFRVPDSKPASAMQMLEIQKSKVAEVRERQAKQLSEKGRELWSELHSTVTIETLPQWEEKIPNYSCKCKAFYNAWKIDNPPRPDDFFAWTVELHNAVNRKLEKPEMTLEEARSLWLV